MKTITFTDVNEIYACCNQHILRTLVVDHPGANAFALGLRKLERRLGTLHQDRYWIEFLRPLKQFRFQIAWLPFPFNFSPFISPDLVRAIQEIAPKCKYIYPDYSEDVASLAETTACLITSREAPLADALRNELDEIAVGRQKGILFRGSLAISLGDELRCLLGDSSLKIVTPPGLLASSTFEYLLAIGPLRWFPTYIRTGPRFRHLTCIRYDWLADHMYLAPSFITSDARTTFKHSIAHHFSHEDSHHSRDTIDPSDITPLVNWTELNAEISRLRQDPEDVVKVEARLLLLAGSIAVYVEASADSSLQVLTFDETERIRRIPTQDLMPGMHILLRINGGGSLVVPIADRILGAKASEVRFIQRQWKLALSKLVCDQGEDIVVRELVELGCKRASRLNLRNWISDRNIRPEFDDDFLSILVLCGLDGNHKLFVKNARLLDRVHRRAGFEIRKMLLAQIGRADLGQLLNEGKMEFELPSALGGTFAAYRVEESSTEVFPTPITHINQLFSVGHTFG